MPRAKVIAVYNIKGGVAKTTTCANLAMELADHSNSEVAASLSLELNGRGKKVLVIDADQQENLSYALGVPPTECKMDLNKLLCYEIFDIPYRKDLSSVIVRTDYGCDLIPGSADLCNIDRTLYSACSIPPLSVEFIRNYYADNYGLKKRVEESEEDVLQYIESYERIYNEYLKFENSFYDRMSEAGLLTKKANGMTIFRDIIARIRDKYDYIIIDCPPSLSALMRSVLLASDSIIVPATPSAPAMNGIINLVSAVKEIKATDNPTLSFSGLLYTMVEKNRIATREVRSQFETDINRYMYIYKTQIPRAAIVEQAQLAGLPLVYYDQDNPTRLAYSRFCDEFLEREDV